MTVWIPILTGILAFIGVIAGHFLSFDLNTAAKRREVRRVHIERFAELLSEDIAWTHNYLNEKLYGEGKYPSAPSPYDKAYALYILYFSNEISEPMEALVLARHQYIRAVDIGWGARLELAQSWEHIAVTPPPQAERDAANQMFRPYYQALLNCLRASSVIARETIPEKSQIIHWCSKKWANIRGRFSGSQ